MFLFGLGEASAARTAGAFFVRLLNYASLAPGVDAVLEEDKRPLAIRKS